MAIEPHLLHLNQEQFDFLEEAADVMALGHIYVDSFEEAVQYLAKWYIESRGPEFEAEWCDNYLAQQPGSPT